MRKEKVEGKKWEKEEERKKSAQGA